MGRIKDCPAWLDFNRKCICGEEGVVFWLEEDKVVVFCESCAFDVLPSLIADAVPFRVNEYQASAAKNWWALAEKRFWQAMTNRLSKFEGTTRKGNFIMKGFDEDEAAEHDMIDRQIEAEEEDKIESQIEEDEIERQIENEGEPK